MRKSIVRMTKLSLSQFGIFGFLALFPLPPDSPIACFQRNPEKVKTILQLIQVQQHQAYIN